MSKTIYESLEIYQPSEELARLVWVAVKEWPSFEKSTLGRQLARSADSIGVNIAEGFGRRTTADQQRFLRIVRGSIYETKHWLRLAFTRGLLIGECIERLKPLIDRLPPKLNAYIRVVGRPKGFDNQQSTVNNRI